MIWDVLWLSCIAVAVKRAAVVAVVVGCRAVCCRALLREPLTLHPAPPLLPPIANA